MGRLLIPRDRLPISSSTTSTATRPAARAARQRRRDVFGYTSCPDVCPGTLAQYRHVKRLLQEKLEDEADRVQFVFVTVDPQRDTQERLREYISLFDSDFKGLWADAETLQQVWRDYGIIVERVDVAELRRAT